MSIDFGGIRADGGPLTIEWLVFLPGVVLLLFPANGLLSSLVQLRTFESFNNLDSSVRHRPWWWVPALWIDPLRGFGGAWLVKASLPLEALHWSQVPVGDYALLIGALVIGLSAQLYTRREEGVLLAPIGFLLGLTTALLPWPVAGIALVGGITGMFAFRHFQSFFLGGGLSVAFLGFVLRADPLWLVPVLVLFTLPIGACFITGKTLELPTRDATGKDVGRSKKEEAGRAET